MVGTIRSIVAIMYLIINTYTDVKSRDIYLFPITLICIPMAIIDIVEFIEEEIYGYVDFWIHFACIVILVAILVPLCRRGKFGEGDIVLVLGLILIRGMHIGIMSLFLATMVSGVFSLYIILFQKRNVSIGIPFAPFMLIGYLAYESLSII